MSAALVVAVAGPTLAGAASGQKTHSCKADVTARVVQTQVNSGSPPASGSATYAGTADGKLCGKAIHGALRSANSFPTPGKFNVTTQAFAPLGSVKSKGSGTGTLNSDGSVTFSGTAKVTGGTGIYKHATGSLTFTGTQAKNSNVAVQHITGTVKY
jgi:hypothetical protein